MKDSASPLESNSAKRSGSAQGRSGGTPVVHPYNDDGKFGVLVQDGALERQPSFYGLAADLPAAKALAAGRPRGTASWPEGVRRANGLSHHASISSTVRL